MTYVEDVRRDAELAAAHGADEPLSVLAVPLRRAAIWATTTS